MSVSVRFRRGLLIRVPVVLRHREECTRSMLLDTGALYTMLHTALAQELSLDMRPAPGVRLAGVTGSAPVSMAVVDEVWLLGCEVRNLRVICHPINKQLGFHGILGTNFLQHFNFSVYNDKEMFTASKWHE